MTKPGASLKPTISGLFFFLFLAQPAIGWAAFKCDLILTGRDRLEKQLSADNLEKLKASAEEAALVPTLVDALAKGDWTHPLLSARGPEAEGVLRAALQAYRSDLIHIEQLATLVVRWEAMTQFSFTPENRHPQPLVDTDGHLTKFAFELFRPSSTERAAIIAAELMREPASERVAWIATIKPEWIGSGERRHFLDADDLALSGAKKWAFGYYAAMRRPHLKYLFREKGLEHVVLSIGAHQAFLRVLAGENAVTFIPEFGLTDLNGVLDGVVAGGRVLALSFPGVDGVLEAEGLIMGRYIGTLHDLDHALNGSKLSADYRRIAAIAAKRLLAYQASLAGGAEPWQVQGHVLKFPDPLVKTIAEKVADLYVLSRMGAPKTIDESLREDFQARSPGSPYDFVVEDMRLHPEAYALH